MAIKMLLLSTLNLILFCLIVENSNQLSVAASGQSGTQAVPVPVPPTGNAQNVHNYRYYVYAMRDRQTRNKGDKVQ